MSKLEKIVNSIFEDALPAIWLGLFICALFFQPYGPLFAGWAFLVLSLNRFFVGFKVIKDSEKNGIVTKWWKQQSIVSAILFLLIGCAFFIYFIQNTYYLQEANDDGFNFIHGIDILISALMIAIGIYRLLLQTIREFK